ncbi:MAG TPA: Vi polysaccharide biosynthesis UDP-N-acetylglucosamine C-6 dehydrogenase TviB, partial [Aquificae bacterium]|nr:Vi polysaccharide biosynthesis UDP-N-acetylglucosamine C-6 dehydrogenase TviB [Aquificota bacterium]
SKVVDVINELKEFGCKVDVYDPVADKEEVKKEYNIDLLDKVDFKNYDAIILAVAHDEFKKLEPQIKKAKEENKSLVIYDVKGLLDKSLVDARL